MTKLETFKLLTIIENVYPLVILKSDTVRRWMAVCEAMDYSHLLMKLTLHLRNNPYPPTLEEIIASTSSKNTTFEWMDEYSIRAENGPKR